MPIYVIDTSDDGEKPVELHLAKLFAEWLVQHPDSTPEKPGEGYSAFCSALLHVGKQLGLCEQHLGQCMSTAHRGLADMKKGGDDVRRN